MQYSNAAIQLIPGNVVEYTSPHKNVTLNNAFQYCYDMRYPTSSLGNNSLDPHLATARDWGGVAYLALSGYGTVSNANGDEISITGVNHNYYTTNGNITGVLDFGQARTSNVPGTFVAAYFEGSTGATYNTKLYLSENSRYVDVIPETLDATTTRGLAIVETQGWYQSAYNMMQKKSLVRRQVLGIDYTDGAEMGKAGGRTTYRPAIWN